MRSSSRHSRLDNERLACLALSPVVVHVSYFAGCRMEPNESRSENEISAVHAGANPLYSKSSPTHRSPFPLSTAIAVELRKQKQDQTFEDSMDEADIVFARADSEPDFNAALQAAKMHDHVFPLAWSETNSADVSKRRMKASGEGGEVTSIHSHFPSLKLQTATVSQTPVILFIQMELCGKTLRDWIQERNLALNKASFSSGEEPVKELSAGMVMDVIECNRILKHILKGIDYIHSKGLIHRDLKVIVVTFNVLFRFGKNYLVGLRD